MKTSALPLPIATLVFALGLPAFSVDADQVAAGVFVPRVSFTLAKGSW